MPRLLHPLCHLATDLTLDLWRVACGLQWWSLCRIVCLYCCIPMPPHHRSNPGSMEGGPWALIVLLVATSTAIECVFLQGCQLLSFTRNQLHAWSVHAFLYMGSW